MDTYNINIDKDGGCLIVKQGGSDVVINEKYIEVRKQQGDHIEIIRYETNENLDMIFTHRTEPIPPTYRSVPCAEE